MKIFGFALYLIVLLLYGIPLHSHIENDLGKYSNTIIVTDNGLEMFHWDLDFVRHAEQSIEISAVFLGGEIAQQLFDTLNQRLSEVSDLQVYILTTPILLEEEDWEKLHALQTRYPDRFHVQHATTVAIIWPDVSGIDNHIKMFIVDEKYFSAGGTNLDETQCSEGTWTPKKKYNKAEVISHNLPAGMRDQDIVGKGPLAKELRKSFYQFYALWENYNQTSLLQRDPEIFKEKNRYFPVVRQGTVEKFDQSEQQRTLYPDQIKKIIGGPHQSPNAISDAYVRLIREAQHEIIIGNMYFCPISAIFEALLEAVNRGVSLTILTNGASEITPEYTSFFCWANRLNYVPILFGQTFHFWDAWSLGGRPVKKTRIFEYHVRDILFHKKTMIVDRKKSIVGSYNLGMRSDIGDYEMILEIDSSEIAEDLIRVHQRDLHFSKEISPHEACDWYFDPVKSYIGEIQKRFHGLL